MDTLLSLIDRYNSLPETSPLRSQIAGLIGEAAAEFKATELFGKKILNKLILPRRGTKGAVIFDLVFELEGNEGILIEAKFNTAVLGTTRELAFAADELGNAQKTILKGTIDQLSGPWVKDRIQEIRNPDRFQQRYSHAPPKAGKPAATAGAGSEKSLAQATDTGMSRAERNRLANKLNHMLESQRLHVLEMQTVPVFQDGKIVDLSVHVQDETASINAFVRDGRRGIGNRAVRDAAKEVEKLAADIRLEKAALPELESIERNAGNELSKAKTILRREQKALKTVTREAAVARRSMKVLTAESEVEARTKALESAKQRTKQARARIKEYEVKQRAFERRQSYAASAQREEAISRRKFNNDMIRNAEVRHADDPDRGLIKQSSHEGGEAATRDTKAEQVGERSPHTGETAANAATERRALTEGASLDRGVSTMARSTEHSIANVAKAESGLKTLGTVERLTKAEIRLARLAKVVSIVRSLGHLAIAMVLPLSILDAVFQAAIMIFEWDQKRRRADQEEWERIIQFLIGKEERRTVLLVQTYQTSISTRVGQEINNTLFGNNNSVNFISWYNRWDADRTFLGFVYPVIRTTLQRQLLPEWPGRDEEIRYYTKGPVQCGFANNTQFHNNSRKQIDGPVISPDDPKNRFTGGPDHNPGEHHENLSYKDYLASVNLYMMGGVSDAEVKVKYIIPSPVLTPFDFVTFRCRNLMMDLLQFISYYDDNFITAYPFEENNFWVKNFLENASFAAPVQSRQTRWCVDTLLYFIVELAGDARILSQDWIPAREKRKALLARLIQLPENRKRLLDLRNTLLNVVNPDERRRLDELILNRSLITPSYLYESAVAIENDLHRVWKDITSDNKFRSYPYEYRGVPDSEYEKAD